MDLTIFILNIAENLRRFQTSLPANVKMVVVSKTEPVEAIRQAYEAGQRVFGENRVRELLTKQTQLPSDIEWHFIGHLQTNKVRYIAPFIRLIHSIDSLNLLSEINKEALKNDRIIDCLLQFYIATEETKFGFDIEEVVGILGSDRFKSMENIRITGVMGMGSFTDDTTLIRQEFKTLSEYFQLLKSRYFKQDNGFRELSMGMSGDYPIAIEEGSTMIRIGSAIFGDR